MKRTVTALIALLLIIIAAIPAHALPPYGETVDAVFSLHRGEDGALLSGVLAEGAGSTDADWFAFAAGIAGERQGADVYLTMLSRYAEAKYREAGALDPVKSTEWHRIALTVLALGGDPTDFAGHDLIKEGVFFRKDAADVDAQGISGVIFALITVDSMRYPTPEGARDDRNSLLSTLLSYQNPDGGFPQIMRLSDPDTTAMALIALAPYLKETFPEVKTETETVRSAADAALNYLSETQLADGAYRSMGKINCESTAQVLLALTALDIAPDDPRFVKDSDLLTALYSFRAENGGFYHTKEDEKPSPMAGQQAALALIALDRHEKGLPFIYDLRKTENSETDPAETVPAEPKAEEGTLSAETLEKIRALPDPLSTDDETSLVRLLSALRAASDREKYAAEEALLTEGLKEIDRIKDEITALDREIGEWLKADENAEAGRALLARTEALSEGDRAKVERLPELRTALAGADAGARSGKVTLIVSAAAALLLIASVTAAVLRRAKKKKNENPDW